MPLHTTFNLLKKAGACGQEVGCDIGYDKLATYLGGTQTYGKNTPIPLLTILDSNGLNDALWCLCAVLPEERAQRDRIARLVACDYAEGKDGAVLALYETVYPNDTRLRDCIATARRYANGLATLEELADAGVAARAAEADAWVAAGVAGAAGAARAARGSAEAAAGAAWAVETAAEAARSAERKWQTQVFSGYLTRGTDMSARKLTPAELRSIFPPERVTMRAPLSEWLAAFMFLVAMIALYFVFAMMQ